jgi:16S rRNA (guanine527-N7)-methyltransferase
VKRAVNPNYVDDRLTELAAEYRLPAPAPERLKRLLLALAAEPDPHTTVSDPVHAVNQHVADSLVALQLDAMRTAQTIADVGSGAGFPALPLAIAKPDAAFDLLEGATRKVDLISRLAASAGIFNARPLAVRAEAWAAREGRAAYEVVTARAVAPLAVLVEYAAPLLRENGLLVAWKGSRNEPEETAGEKAAELIGMTCSGVIRVVPYPGARSLHLYLYLKQSTTPERFPRRPGIAAKRPLA